MTHWCDEEIMRALADPSRRSEACAALVRTYGPMLRGFLCQACNGDSERAEDLLNVAFCKAYRGLSEMKEPCRSLKAWLFTVTLNVRRDDLRTKASRDPMEDAVEWKDEILEAVLTPPPDEERESDSSRTAAVAELLRKLEAKDRRYRALLEMECVAQCSRDEIAAATGIEKRQLAQYIKTAKAYALKMAEADPVLAAWAERLKDRDGA